VAVDSQGCAWAAMRRSNSGQHPPHWSPAPHLSAIELTDDAPAASAALIVRSVTAWHEQTIIATHVRTP